MRAIRHVFERPERARRFGTQLEGLQRRKGVHVCVACGHRYTEGKGRTVRLADGRRRTNHPRCDAPEWGCGGRMFAYFPSTGEADRYAHLRMQERAGLIEDLVLHRRWPLQVRSPNGALVTIAELEIDFEYIRLRDGERILEDFKGGLKDEAATRLWAHKRAHFQAQYGAQIHVYSEGNR